MDRRLMADILEEHLRSVSVYFDREKEFPKGRGPLKTYVVEAHAPNGDPLDHEHASELLQETGGTVGFRTTATDDKSLFQVSKDDVGFFFDLLDPRFWVIHTMSNVDVAEDSLFRLLDSYPNLDHAWPPSGLMRSIQRTGRSTGFTIDFDETELMPAEEEEVMDEPDAVVKFSHRGTGAESWLTELERFAPSALAFSMVKFTREDSPRGSYIISELNERGRLKAAGNSVDLHLQTVSSFLREYRSFILAIEDVARLRSVGHGDGGELLGEPIVLEFQKPLRHFDYFVRELVSCREPLKIWGIAEQAGTDCVQIEAVDLHSASRFRIDLTPEYMRLYLGPSACGNTVARLLRNLQSHVNSAITVELPTDHVSSLS